MPLLYRELGPDRVAKLVRDQMATADDVERRREYSRRALILRDKFSPLVYERITGVYAKKVSHIELLKFVEAGTNVLNRVVRELAFVYARPPARRLRVTGPIGEALNTRLAAADREARLGVQAKQWGQYAFALNVIWILPGVWDRVGGQRLEYQMVTPNNAQRITGEDPNYTDILLWPNADGGWCCTDGEAYRWLDKAFLEVRRVEHQLGRQPAQEFRLSIPPPDDYWDVGRGHKLVDATIECGRIAATMSWVRKAQNRKLITVFGNLKAMDREEVSSPDAAITGSGDDAAAIQFDVHEFVTLIDGFKDEMRWHIEQAIESFGIPITAVDPEPGSTGDAVNVFAPAGPQLHAAQTELREDQIEFARPFDRDLHITAHDLLARFRHPFSLAPDLVREHFEARWQPLTFIDHPLKRLEVFEKKMALGLMTHGDAMLEEYGDMTPEQAHERVLANLRAKAAVDLFYAAHNMGVDPRVQSVPQLQGRLGGEQKAANAEEDEDAA